MELQVIEKCGKLFAAYEKLIARRPQVTTSEVMANVQEAAETYITLLKCTEFATQMIGNVVYHIIELETLRTA